MVRGGRGGGSRDSVLPDICRRLCTCARAFHWGEAGESSAKCSDSYAGAAPANQPEIAQAQDYIRNDGRFK